MKEVTEEFKTTELALNFIDTLNKDKIKGLLNCSQNKDGSYNWLVTYKKGKVK